ncbi:MAG TPA: TolC family protein [Opitutaceae bacterium]|nr:TolC family protein [Opitutaceae bacterium]
MKHVILACVAFAVGAHALSGAPGAQDSGAQLPSPLDLKGAIGYALDHNYAILQAREAIRLQEGVVIQVRSQEIPNVSAQGQWQRNDASISQLYPPSTSLWNVELKATQTLFAGGGVVSAVKGAKLTRDAAAFDLQTAIDTALLDVRTKFYNVLLAREKIRVEEENVRLYEHQLEDTKNQFASGTVSNFEVLRAKVFLANAQPNLITARNSYRIALEQLRQSLGTPGASSFPEVAGDLDVKPAAYDSESALASAREHRPELRRLGKLREAAQESVTTARSGLYPNLQAFGSYQWDGFTFASPTNGNVSSNGWLFGLQSTWSIFDGRATYGKVRQAKSQLEQARLATASEELEIDVEVRQAVSTLQEAAELVTASKQTIDQAAEALRLAEAKFHAGSATQLDVLTSQVSLTQAKTDQLTANYNYLVAVANVRKAVGLNDALVIP